MGLEHWHKAMRSMQSLCFTFTPNQEKHRLVWSAIFKTSKWASKFSSKGLNPVLLGCDLEKLYRNTGEPVYLVLTTGDSGGRTYEEDLLESLQKHEFDRTTMEVSFRATNITLNIRQPFQNAAVTSLDMRKLFSNQGCYSASLHWRDSHHRLQIIADSDIVGLELNGSKDLAMVCGLLVRNPEDPKVRQFQECFKDLKCPPVIPIVLPGQSEARFCLGWKIMEPEEDCWVLST